MGVLIKHADSWVPSPKDDPGALGRAGERSLNPGSSPGDGDDLKCYWLPSPQELSQSANHPVRPYANRTRRADWPGKSMRGYTEEGGKGRRLESLTERTVKDR